MLFKITCFGEYLLRLAPPGAYRFTQADSFDAVYGGAEANVAAALANFGEEASFVTKLPDHAIGDAAIQSIRASGVQTEHILRGGERIGIYFLEKGSSVRASKVIYDRKNSSIAQSKPDEYDWNAILSGSTDFFFTGITAALSVDMPLILRGALDFCKNKGIRVTCDINYRAALWTPDKAGSVMRRLVKGIDTLVVNEEHAALLLDVRSDAADENERLHAIAKTLIERYDIGQVILTLRRSLSADDNLVSAVLYDRASGTFVRANEYAVHIVDRVGGGDALSAGVIYANAHGFAPEKAIEFGTAANALKHSIHGDALLASVGEIEAVMASKSGDGTVRMIR
ncbi:MAG: sugar kinase [Clostridia bacterium]|nr:sugar kinase [Clostridia bacterium]